MNDLYKYTAERLGRVGIKDPTSLIITLAQEIESYRARIKQMQDYIGHLTEGRNRVPYHEREKVYREAIEVHGATAQQIVALEELSEAQKEICKLLRSQGSLDHLAEEVPTVLRDKSYSREPQPCVVTYVNRRHLWYEVKFKNGIRECYKLPRVKEA